MKKIYLSLAVVLAGTYVNAQINNAFVSAQGKKDAQFGLESAKPTNNNVVKAEGDVIWSDDFSTPANWVTSNAGAPAHTGGDWAIINAVPASLVSQAPSYGFPTAMLSASGGNFAFINSDAAGASAMQNASITTATGVDVAAALATSGSPANAAIFLQFKEIYRHFQELNFVEISNDGGVTWISFPVNAVPEVPVNTNSGNPETEVVNITSAIGGGNWGSDVRIRFRYQGAYDWFWGIDDVELVEAWDNDIKISRAYVATDMATTNGIDYRLIPTSQTSFPGLTFGAKVINNGGANQASVAYTATDGGSYNETGTAIAIASGAIDSVSVSTPYMVPAAIGTYTINTTTTLPTADADNTNNTSSISLARTNYVYGCDNGVSTGSVSQISSQDGQELAIGNFMDVFDDMTVTGVQVRLMNQPLAVGQEISGQIYIFDGADFVLLEETQYHSIVTSDLNTIVTMKFLNPVLISGGETILVMAHHLGGANEVAFGLAQNAIMGNVAGVAADGSLFNLLSPSVVMVRLTEDPSLSIADVNTLEGVKVYPNPSTGIVNISNDKNVANTITVTDLTGKVVTSKVASVATTIDLSNAGTGIYLVEIANANGKKVERVVIK